MTKDKKVQHKSMNDALSCSRRKDSTSHTAKKQFSKLTKQVGKRSGNSFHSLKKITPLKATLAKSKIHAFIQQNDRENLAKFLRKQPQQIDKPDEMGRTPLQLACLEGRFEIVTLLLQLGCDVDIRERQGWTALHFACACLNQDALRLVQCLIKKGNAYVLAENNSGATPLHYLVLNNACEETALFLEVLTLMTSRGADVNSQDKNGETPLHQAALRGLEESVVMLINTQHVNLNLVDSNGETCLHYAVRGGHLNTLKILLSMGANFSIAGNSGTCLKVAENEGHFHIIEYLRAWENEHSTPMGVVIPPASHLASITYNTKLLEAAEMMGIEPSIAIACLYHMQKRGEPTDDLHALMEEVNKCTQQNRECTVCLSNSVNSLFMPCRHSAACLECAELVKDSNNTCPICREPITDILQIFIS